jgi:hypothetical protein
MKKIKKSTILNILNLLYVLLLISCDGGGGDGDGGGGGGGDASLVPINDVRNLDVIAYNTLIDGEVIEYREPGSSNVFDVIEFNGPNLTDGANRFGRVYVYDSEVGGDQDFQTSSIPSDGNPTARQKLQNAVNTLIGLGDNIDGNSNFINLIRGGINDVDDLDRFEEMSTLLNIYGAETFGEDFISAPQNEDDFFAEGPTFYDHLIDSTYNAIFEAQVIEGDYKCYITKRKIFLDDATNAERAQLDPQNVPIPPKYYIPRIAETQINNLDVLINNRQATLIVEGGRFTVRLINSNADR